MKPQSSHLSVVIPLYNREDYIGITVQSILNQTLLPARIVIVDDGSPDNSAAVVRAINNPLIHLIQQENRGVSAARNRGIAAVKTDYVAFVDADDEWLPNHLERLEHLLLRYPQCGVVGTLYYQREKGGENELPLISNKIPFEEEGVLDNYYEVASEASLPLNMSSFAAKKEVLEKIGGFPEQLRSGGEDIMTMARLNAITDIAYSKLPSSIYNLNGSDRKKPRPMLAENPLDKEFYNLLKTAARRRGVRLFVASWYKRRMVGALIMHQWGTALRMFVISFCIKPFHKKLFTSLLMTLYSNLTGKSLIELNRKLKK